MKPINLLPVLSLFLLLAPSNGKAAGSMLRISCDGDDAGAEVLINGKFRGECPLDLQVSEGTLKLLVRKNVGAQRERVYEQEIRMGEGTVKKVEARLGVAKLTASEESRQAENNKRLEEMSFDALQKEAAAGNADAMFKLAMDYSNLDNATPETKELSLSWNLRAAEAGHVRAMERLSAVYKIFRNDIASSMVWAHKAAEAGSADYQMILGSSYEEGKDGLPQSNAEALHWYRRAAEQGHATSMLIVGSFYYSGKAVPQSYEDAVTWWRKAADADRKVAMYLLGRSYAKGEGVSINEEQAIFWWRKAAEGKYPLKEAVEELKKRGLR